MNIKNYINIDKIIRLSLFLVIFFSYLGLAVADYPKDKITVAIIGADDFVPDIYNIKVDGLSDELVSRITEKLVLSNRFDVLERKTLRRVILEQKFENVDVSNIDKLLDKAITDLGNVSVGKLLATGAISAGSDLLKSFTDLGSSVGADYLIYANHDYVKRTSLKVDVPYSDKTITKNVIKSRLYFRIIDSKYGKIIGADSVILNNLSLGNNDQFNDDLALYNEIASITASKIIDIIFPAKVISNDPYVINRGNNDDIKNGALYNIIRQSIDSKADNGILLEKIKTVVGVARVDNVQNTISTISIIKGEAKVNDLIEFNNNEQKISNTVDNNVSNNSSRKATIAVGLIRSGSTARDKNKINEHIPQFTDSIISYLSNTPYFIVVDRQEIDQLIQEQLAQQTIDEMGHNNLLGSLVGAEYMIYGSIDYFRIEEKSVEIVELSETHKTRMGRVQGNIRIVNSKTGEILVSEKISIEKKLKANVDKKIAATDLADAYASKLVNKLINKLYPSQEKTSFNIKDNSSKDKNDSERIIKKPNF